MVTPREHHDLPNTGKGSEHPEPFEAVVIGTGFGGAVTACRLAEAGFRVCILERGRRYGPEDFPRYPIDDLFVDTTGERRSAPIPDLSRWLWGNDRGLFEICDLDHAIAVQAAGYGGGSLIYANVHLRPPYDFFDETWPTAYRGAALEPYFDLAAHMLGAIPVPQRLAKTAQVMRAGQASGSAFHVPLAVHFGSTGKASDEVDQARAGKPVPNRFGREQHTCDMRGRCWLGCDRQAKNTLDLNYLARAEDAGCHVHTLAEVTRITRRDGTFTVHYKDLLVPARPDLPTSPRAAEPSGLAERYVRARNVFLCAGAVNTTKLLFASQDLLWGTQAAVARAALGTRYFPNADSLAAVLNCDEPHEADYGPTITSALLYDQPSSDLFEWVLEFDEGQGLKPLPGMLIALGKGDPIAQLVHAPMLDTGCWKAVGGNAGALMLAPLSTSPPDLREALAPQDRFRILHAGRDGKVTDVASARAAARPIRHRQWLLVQDGGFPPDLEPLMGLFSSPLWLRRNRYLESPEPAGRHAARLDASLRRPGSGQLRLKTIVEALGATSASAMNPRRTFARALNSVPAASGFSATRARALPVGIVSEQLGNTLPEFFVKALAADRNELITRGVAAALPMLSRLLDELSESVVRQIDPSLRRMVSDEYDEQQLIILARGLMRQVLQVLAGSEVAIADKAARTVLEALPDSPMKLADLAAKFLLWAIGYGTITGNTAVLLTMGRDTMRGRLRLDGQRLTAELPSRLADRASAAHEYLLRDIATRHWHGELRTNPGWTTLGKRVTVHSQGGCPMGDDGRGVTDPDGKVHGIEGLYVMDAAAFPASVGVNPSATIAAIAEYKVAKFIKKERGHVSVAEAEAASRWVNEQGRGAVDPLNHGADKSYPVPQLTSIGLQFRESLEGWCVEVKDGERRCDLSNLANVPRDMSSFRLDEERGLAGGAPPVVLKLIAQAKDLARLVSADRAFGSVQLRLGGCATFGGANFSIDRKRSTLELFVPVDKRKFFRYELHLRSGAETFLLHGVKVLDDNPGFDVWHDTATIYFESTGPGVPRRGILRVSLDTFLNVQMRTMKVTGTTDPARQSWALMAFYKYFARELTGIYVTRADDIRKTLFELVTRIHV